MKNYTYTKKVTPEQDSFNVRMNRVRVFIEMAFGRLKSRWRILLKRIDTNVIFVPEIVACCCVLHNIIESRKDEFNVQWLSFLENHEKLLSQPVTEENFKDSHKEGEKIRDALLKHISQYPLFRSFKWKNTKR